MRIRQRLTVVHREDVQILLIDSPVGLNELAVELRVHFGIADYECASCKYKISVGSSVRV
jgi:hypothetical protein